MTKEQIVEKIQKLREEKGYSMNKLAKLAGIGYSNYYRIETKKTDMNVQTLQKICDALEISMSDFFDESVEHIPDKQQWYLVSWIAANERVFYGYVLSKNLEKFIKDLKGTNQSLLAISKIDDNIRKILETNG